MRNLRSGHVGSSAIAFLTKRSPEPSFGDQSVGHVYKNDFRVRVATRLRELRERSGFKGQKNGGRDSGRVSGLLGRRGAR
jgi:hypothetical protein